MTADRSHDSRFPQSEPVTLDGVWPGDIVHVDKTGRVFKAHVLRDTDDGLLIDGSSATSRTPPRPRAQ
jgi:hypothetical protein